jgi:hypothetical protein
LYARRPNVFDVTAFLVSSILVDLELLYSWLAVGSMNHGLWHSFLFVLTIYPAVLSVVLYTIERKLEKAVLRAYGFFRVFPRTIAYPFETVYSSCLIGGVSHVFFDALVHQNSSFVLFPFYGGNPFWIGDWSIIVFAVISLLSVYAIFLWFRHMRVHSRTR